MHPISVNSYSDNLYNPENNSRYRNILFFEADHISSVVTDPGNNQVLSLTVLSGDNRNLLQLSYDDLKSIEELKPVLSEKFSDKRVVISNSLTTLVPEPLLNVVETESYYRLNQKVLPQSQVLYCKMHVQQTASLFNVSNELLKLIRFNLPMVDVYHASLLFIKAVESQKFEQSATRLHLHIHAGYFELLNLDQKIRFYNNFSFSSETEIVYFTLAVAEQLSISHGCDVVLYGNSAQMPEIHALMSKYVRSVQYGIKPKAFTYPLSFKQFGEHQFFTEASALLCE